MYLRGGGLSYCMGGVATREYRSDVEIPRPPTVTSTRYYRWLETTRRPSPTGTAISPQNTDPDASYRTRQLDFGEAHLYCTTVVVQYCTTVVRDWACQKEKRSIMQQHC